MQTQQREAVVQGRSLSPYRLRYTITKNSNPVLENANNIVILYDHTVYTMNFDDLEA
ncbi:MAG: hypothetical protein LBJ00_13660 [Planctomycetaceae bacterium]|nr:hypothetical protein [Planctomycetaceae bacterium]